jgi:hypothetical protein
MIFRGLSHVAMGLFYFVKSLASLSVNYSIYYFRRLVLRQSDQQARKMNDAAYKAYVERQLNPSKGGNTVVPDMGCIFIKGELTEDNKHVHSLWVGNKLSKLEILTLQSFVDCGHVFHLWTYEPLLNDLPDGVIMEEANRIIPQDKVFRYKNVNKYGHGKGSVSGFSDIFRYKLLYEMGGWWTDMDVTCIKALNVADPYFFRKHHDLELVGNVMKCPAKSPLMLACYEEATKEVDETNTDWHKPIAILNKHVFGNNLQQYIRGHVSNVDVWHELVPFVIGSKAIPANYYFIHWMNEEWRSREIDKNAFRFRSVLGDKMINAGLLQKPVSGLSFLLNDLWHVVFLRVYYYA